ncbi:hypothetical protein FOFC_18580, partial [Fusarium oxysporum]
PDSNKAHNDYQHAPPNVANGGIQVWEAWQGAGTRSYTDLVL